MATESQKPSNDLNPLVENPKETLNITTAKADEASLGSVSGSDDSKTIAPSAETVSDIGRKMRRAERFGISVQLTEQEKRNSRAERFGTGSGSGSGSATTTPSSVAGSGPGSLSGTDSSKKAEELKRKARAERFGAPSPTVASEEDTKKKARLARFAPAAKVDPLEDDKRKARALRFANTQSNSVSEANGKGDVKPQAAAIAGKAGGGA